jgi:hypothetical protein
LKEKSGRTDVPLARRPVRSSAATDACIRRVVGLLTGDRRFLIACRSAVEAQHRLPRSVTLSLRLCVFARAEGRVALR